MQTVVNRLACCTVRVHAMVKAPDGAHELIQPNAKDRQRSEHREAWVKFTFFSAIPTFDAGQEFRCGRISEFSHASVLIRNERNPIYASDEIHLWNRLRFGKWFRFPQWSTQRRIWAFIALCDYGSLWLYHGSWSRIEGITADYRPVERFKRKERIESARCCNRPATLGISCGSAFSDDR